MGPASAKARSAKARALLAVTGVVAASTLIGCASAPVAVRYAGPAVQGQGSSDAVVFPTPTVLALQSDDAPLHGVTSGWRDRSTSVRAERDTLTESLWAQPARPTLARTRRVPLPNRADTVVYFQQEGVAWRNRGVIFYTR